MTKKLMVLAAAVGAAATVFGAGVASADQNYNGMKYSEALSKIKASGLKAKVSARVGDQLSEGDCLVTGYTRSAAPPIGYTLSSVPTVMISLDCNGAVASDKGPGYSAASPEGRKAVETQKKMEWLATPAGQVYCVKAVKDHPDWGLTCPPPAAPA